MRAKDKRILQLKASINKRINGLEMYNTPLMSRFHYIWLEYRELSPDTIDKISRIYDDLHNGSFLTKDDKVFSSILADVIEIRRVQQLCQ